MEYMGELNQASQYIDDALKSAPKEEEKEVLIWRES